jgi:hypothetical protein
MKQNKLWKLFIVLGLLTSSFYEMYPPVKGDLAEHFRQTAVGQFKDETYTNIVKRLDELEQKNPQQQFANLAEAVGDSDITRYFPQKQYLPARQEATLRGRF